MFIISKFYSFLKQLLKNNVIRGTVSMFFGGHLYGTQPHQAPRHAVTYVT